MGKHGIPFLAPFYLALVLSMGSCSPGTVAIQPGSWDHIVVVWEENKDASQVIDLPYISQLRAAGMTFSRCYGVARPSQPNYIAMFAGSTLGVSDNNNHDLSGETLYSRLAGASMTMVSYAEGLPSVGFRGASSGRYVRKHLTRPRAAIFPTPSLRCLSERGSALARWTRAGLISIASRTTS